MFFIPVPNGSDTTQTVTLDSIQYVMRIRWNTLSELWTISIGLIGKGFACQVPVTVGFDILASHKAFDGVPKGNLYAIDTEKTTGRIDRDNFTGTKSRFRLLYIEEDEL